MRSLRFDLQSALLLIVCLLSLAGNHVFAGEEDDAQVAATSIRRSIANQEYDDLWDNRVSEFFKAKVRKSDFIQNLRQGRSQVGLARTVTPISHTYSEVDLATGFQGKIYSFDYHVKYDKVAFFERVVVSKDPDGRYRLSGLWANPAP